EMIFTTKSRIGLKRTCANIERLIAITSPILAWKRKPSTSSFLTIAADIYANDAKTVTKQSAKSAISRAKQEGFKFQPGF
ncbi:MAG: hypothetical protein OSB45_07545, partial [Pseudomonadales bacterium]|nr:hypothetical protein [Pseudomonadales bacterium]